MSESTERSSTPQPSENAPVFPVVLRGYARNSVDRFVVEVSESLGDFSADRERLSQRIAELESKLSQTKTQLSQEVIAGALGEEATSVLRSAAVAATSIRERAEEYSQRLMADADAALEIAKEDAAQMLDSANDLIKKRSQEQEQLALDLLKRADKEASTIQANARTRAEAILNEAHEEEQRILARAKELKEHLMRQLSEQVESVKEEIYSLIYSREQVLTQLRQTQSEVSQIERKLERSSTIELDLLYKALGEGPMELVDLDALGSPSANGTSIHRDAASVEVPEIAESADLDLDA